MVCGRVKESPAWTPLHKNYNSRQSTDGQHCLVSSFLKETGRQAWKRQEKRSWRNSNYPQLYIIQYSSTLSLEIMQYQSEFCR